MRAHEREYYRVNEPRPVYPSSRRKLYPHRDVRGVLLLGVSGGRGALADMMRGEGPEAVVVRVAGPEDVRARGARECAGPEKDDRGDGAAVFATWGQE